MRRGAGGLAHKLKVARTMKALTQQAAADASGVSLQSLSRYERGHREPPLEALRALAALYEIAPEGLLSNENSEIGSQLPFANIRIPASLPLVPIRGYVSAGTPRDVWELDLGHMPVSGRLLKRYPNLFALIVSGDSLMGDGIHDEEIVLVDPNARYETGKIYIVRLDDNEVCARHMTIEDGHVRLRSSNDHYEDLRVTGIRVVGRVVAHLRDLDD